MKFPLVLVLLWSFSLVSHAQSVPPEPLSLPEALALARRNAPTLEAARARVEAAGARLRGARALPNPTLALAQPFAVSGERGATGGFDEGVLASQTIEGPGKRGARSAIARGEQSAATFDLAASGTSLDFAVKSAYFDVLRAAAERDLARETLENTGAFLVAARERERAGDAPKRDVLRAQTEVERAQTALETAVSEAQTRRATLASLTGAPEVLARPLSDALAFSPLRFEVGALESYALEHRADVLGARARLAARQAGIQSAKNARRPDAFVEARVAQLLPQSGDARGTSLRVGVTLPLFDFGQIKAGVAEARANLGEESANGLETLRVARLEVETARQNLLTSQKAVQSFQNGRLERAKTLLDMARDGYAEGATSLLEVLDARAVFRAEQTDYFRALAAYNTAVADLERSVGGVLPVPSASPDAAPSAGQPQP